MTLKWSINSKLKSDEVRDTSDHPPEATGDEFSYQNLNSGTEFGKEKSTLKLLSEKGIP